MTGQVKLSSISTVLPEDSTDFINQCGLIIYTEGQQPGTVSQQVNTPRLYLVETSLSGQLCINYNHLHAVRIAISTETSDSSSETQPVQKNSYWNNHTTSRSTDSVVWKTCDRLIVYACESKIRLVTLSHMLQW